MLFERILRWASSLINLVFVSIPGFFDAYFLASIGLWNIQSETEGFSSIDLFEPMDSSLSDLKLISFPEYEKKAKCVAKKWWRRKKEQNRIDVDSSDYLPDHVDIVLLDEAHGQVAYGQLSGLVGHELVVVVEENGLQRAALPQATDHVGVLAVGRRHSGLVAEVVFLYKWLPPTETIESGSNQFWMFFSIFLSRVRNENLWGIVTCVC